MTLVQNSKIPPYSRKSCASCAGFTLVEIAISMVIISSIIAMGVTLIPRLAYDFQEKGTYQKIEYVHRAISAYAQKYNRIPCPAEPNQAVAAEPFGTERGSGAAGQNIGACTTLARRQGIVPWRTLGLNYEDIKDNFGNLLTYRVSETPTRVFNAGTDELNNWCRTEPKWNDGVNDIDPDKAAFCCGFSQAGNMAATLATDIRVEGPFGPLPDSSRNIANHGMNDAEYSATTDPTPTSADLQNMFRPSYAAYALISHGPNGRGSYDFRGTQVTAPAAIFLSNEERNNALNTTTVTYVQDNTFDVPNAADPGVGIKQPLDFLNIDDIVSWRNPFQIYSGVGHASCAEARQ